MDATLSKQALLSAVEYRLKAIGDSAPALLDQASVDKIYEIFVLTCLVKALKRMGAKLTACNSYGGASAPLRFRMGPGLLYGPSSQPSFILVELEDRMYEIQNSLRVIGKSGVLHELDVSLIEHEQADEYRQALVNLTSSSVRFLAECKYYGSNLPLHLGREYLGLSREFTSTRVKALVSNRGSADVRKLVRKHQGTVMIDLTSLRYQGVEDFVGWIIKELEQVLK